jgi:hypothetical protein
MRQKLCRHRTIAADGGITPLSHGNSKGMAATRNLDQSMGYVGADCRPAAGRVPSLLLAKTLSDSEIEILMINCKGGAHSGRFPSALPKRREHRIALISSTHTKIMRKKRTERPVT